MTRATVRDVRGLCGAACGAETRDWEGLCVVCGVRPNVGAYARVSPYPNHTDGAHAYVPTPAHPAHPAQARRSAGFRRAGPCAGANHPAHPCSRAGAIPPFSLSRKKAGEGGKHGWR